MSPNTKPLPCLTQKAALWYTYLSLAFLAKQEGGVIKGWPRLMERGGSFFASPSSSLWGGRGVNDYTMCGEKVQLPGQWAWRQAGGGRSGQGSAYDQP